MAILINHSRFAATLNETFDAQCRHWYVVVVAATFEVPPGKPPRPVEPQPEVQAADEYQGDPARSSVIREGEFAPEKPTADVIVIGSAHAPGGRPAESVVVSLRVGTMHKTLRVSGNRTWRGGVLGLTPSAPEPFRTMPVIYERAFGGVDERGPQPEWEMRNPSGVGFRGAPPADPALETEVPNIEYPSTPISSVRDRPAPAGFGVVAKSWLPRSAFGGTYDEAWVKNQYPMLPDDFDPRFYQSAPADQQLTAVRGGETVELLNMTPEGAWRFTLPVLNVPADFWYPGRHTSAKLRVDTIILEPDAYRVSLLARTKVMMARNRSPLDVVSVGHATAAWRRARARGKIFIDWAANGGRLPGAEDYVA